MNITPLKIEDWGLLDYRQAFDRQAAMIRHRLSGSGADTLILVEHPPTVTLGRRASNGDLHFPESYYNNQGIALQKINRGGLATAHEPGQLVVYPLIQLKKKDLRWFSDCFLRVVIDVVAEYGLTGALKEGDPGVWVDGRKICSFGIALKKWISSHGIALNVNNNLNTFKTIVPCGHPGEIVTSVMQETGRPIDLQEIKGKFIEFFCRKFAYSVTSDSE